MISALRMTTVVGALLLCFSLLLRPAAAKPDDAAIEAQIKAVHAEITKAAEAVDAEKLFSFVLDNNKGCLIQRSKIVLTRQEALDSYKKNIAGVQKVKYTFNQQYVTVVSPESAVMVTEGSYEVTTTDGRTFGLPFAQTVIFVLKDKEWKVLHSHTSSPSAPQ